MHIATYHCMRPSISISIAFQNWGDSCFTWGVIMWLGLDTGPRHTLHVTPNRNYFYVAGRRPSTSLSVSTRQKQSIQSLTRIYRVHSPFPISSHYYHRLAFALVSSFCRKIHCVLLWLRQDTVDQPTHLLTDFYSPIFIEAAHLLNCSRSRCLILI